MRTGARAGLPQAAKRLRAVGEHWRQAGQGRGGLLEALSAVSLLAMELKRSDTPGNAPKIAKTH